jgi:cysteine-S-conjugate beta-lyase
MWSRWRTAFVQPNQQAPQGFRSLVPAIARGSTTLFEKTADIHDSWDQTDRPYAYGLYGTPTVLELAARIRDVEGGHATLITPGGLSAIALVYLSCLASGDQVLIPESVYGPSRDLATTVLARLGVEPIFYPPAAEDLGQYITSSTRLVWCESPGSMTFEVQDVPAIVAAAHRAGAVVALDNTWSAGVLFRAFDHGVDVSVQALTKYVGGHSDLLLGSVTAADQATYDRLGKTAALLGMSVSPDDAYLALRGLQTMAVRMPLIEQSALDIARWLSRRTEIERVLHPALPTCPGHEFWRRDFLGSSGAFAIVFGHDYSAKAVASFIDALRLFKIGYSWGGVVSLAMPLTIAPARGDDTYGHRLVRLSVGLEDPSDLRADLEGGLDAMAAQGRSRDRNSKKGLGLRLPQRTGSD